MKRSSEDDTFTDEDPDEDEGSDDLEDEDISEEDEDEGAEESFENGPPAKVSKKDKVLYKAPTSAELNTLKEAETMFQSNLFKLQISEMLSEVMLKEKHRCQIQDAVDKLKEILLALPSEDPHQIQDVKWLERWKIKVPVTQTPKLSTGDFRFVAPSSIKCVGSFALGTCIRPDVCADLVLELPKEFLQVKDCVNQCYFRKRALYLAVIAGHLKTNKMVADLKFSYHQGQHMKPVLIVEMTTESGKNVKVQLHCGIPAERFPFNRLKVDKSNVRKNWFNQTDSQCQESESAPTPVYNSMILEDMLHESHMAVLEKAQTDTLGVRDGIVLLKVWLRQRQLDKGYGCFSGFIMSMYVAYLLSSRKIHRLMSSYQVMRNTLVSLASSDWLTSPPSFESKQSTPLELFQQHFDVVFVDPSGCMNLCAGVTESVYKRVRHEANIAIQVLESSDHNTFESLLLKPVPFRRKFDQFIHISATEVLRDAVSRLDAERRLIDHCGDYQHACLPAIVKLVEKALGDRIQLIQPALTMPLKWNVTETAPGTVNNIISLGLLINPDSANRIIDKGPPAQLPQAAEFREFWGEKSELRRFQDSSINEAVVWTKSSLISKRRLVCAKIVKYILNRHTGIPVCSITHISHQLDTLLHLPKPGGDKSLYGTGEEEHLLIVQSLDQLSKLLHGLENIPLSVKTVQGVLPVFRFSEVFPAMPAIPVNIQTKDMPAGSSVLPLPIRPSPFYLPALNVMCQLEGSGKWPDDLEAIRRVKAAFFIQLAEALRKKDSSLFIRVSPEHLDVLKNGYVFRLILGYLREITLARMSLSADGCLQSNETEESRRLQIEYIARPKLSSTLHGIQQQHNTFSGAVRLAKRWISSHMMLDHIPEEAVELIVASLYTTPAPYTCPGSPLVGFLRFLQHMSNFDWKTQALLVNLNNEFTKETISNIQNLFTEDRSKFPLMSICTPQDPSGGHWTKDLPSAPVLQRLVLLARQSLNTLEQQLHQDFLKADFKIIFRPPLDIFDQLIYLKKRQLPRQHHAVDITKNTKIPRRESETTWDRMMPVVDWDPVQMYLKELRTSFDNLALFFHDKYGGSVIGVMWKPTVKETREFKVSNLAGCEPDSKSGNTEVRLKVNTGAILDDMMLMGSGLVSHLKKGT